MNNDCFWVAFVESVSEYESASRIRSSRPEVFCKNGAFKNFTEFTGKNLPQSLFFNKFAGLGTGVFPVDIVRFLRTAFFYRTLPLAPSAESVSKTIFIFWKSMGI